MFDHLQRPDIYLQLENASFKAVINHANFSCLGIRFLGINFCPILAGVYRRLFSSKNSVLTATYFFTVPRFRHFQHFENCSLIFIREF